MSQALPAGAPGLPGAWRGDVTGLRDALHAEWTKLRTVSGPAWLLAGTIVLTVAVSAAATAAVKCPSGTACPVDTPKLSLTGIEFGQAVVAILAVLVISGEYSTGMIRITLTAMPRRSAVLAAKAVIVAGLVLAAGTIAVGGSLLAGRVILPGHGFTPGHGFPLLSLADGPTLRAAAGSVLYLALIALLSLGIATIVRESAVAIGDRSRAAVPLSDHHFRRGRRPGLVPPPRAVRADECRAHHPGHHRPARPAHQPVGRPRRARRLGGGRDAGRRARTAVA